MFTVLVYDVPSNENGVKRQSKIRKLCKKYGYHVQNSTFEFDTDYSTILKIEMEVEKLLNAEEDSVRVYILGRERTCNNTHILGKREDIESSDSSFVL